MREKAMIRDPAFLDGLRRMISAEIPALGDANPLPSRDAEIIRSLEGRLEIRGRTIAALKQHIAGLEARLARPID